MTSLTKATKLTWKIKKLQQTLATLAKNIFFLFLFSWISGSFKNILLILFQIPKTSCRNQISELATLHSVYPDKNGIPRLCSSQNGSADFFILLQPPKTFFHDQTFHCMISKIAHGLGRICVRLNASFCNERQETSWYSAGWQGVGWGVKS